MTQTRIALALAVSLLAAAPAAASSRAEAIKDPDARAWWRLAEALSGDAMEGRDIGSPGARRAEQLVAARFAAAGLKPAGDGGTFFQTFPVHESRYGYGEPTVADAPDRPAWKPGSAYAPKQPAAQ